MRRKTWLLFGLIRPDWCVAIMTRSTCSLRSLPRSRPAPATSVHAPLECEPTFVEEACCDLHSLMVRLQMVLQVWLGMFVSFIGHHQLLAGCTYQKPC